MLYIVSTPIGNLKDITLRALEILTSVDGIICEDTRRTSILLTHYEIKKPLFILNDFNESTQLLKIIQILNEGKNLALVSDAGTPLISDPGYKLVRQAIESGIEVDPIPGPSAVLTALTASSLPPNSFVFLGYLPEKQAKRKKVFNNILLMSKIDKFTYIIFIPPHKLINTLKEFKETIGDLEIVLAKELTKINQRVERKKISEFLTEFTTHPKGEFVLLFNL